jgi:hypothetical protein
VLDAVDQEMGVLRVLAGLIVAAGMTAAWMLLACAVMVVSLYVSRLFPLAGKHRTRPRRPV